MSEIMERPLEERLAETAEKLDALETASLALLLALEGGDPDEIVKAKRKLGYVLLNL